MTTLNEAREAVCSKFIDEWADETAVTLDNETFDAPTTEPWVRLSVRNITSGQETLGPVGHRNFERKAILFIQIFTQTDIGLKQSDELAQAARAIFEGITLNGNIAFYDSVTREVGPDGLWYQVVVECNFTYNETK